MVSKISGKTECSGIKVRVKASETFFYIPMYTKCEKNSVGSESGGGVSNGKSDYDLWWWQPFQFFLIPPHRNFSMTLVHHLFDFQIATSFDFIHFCLIIPISF